MGKVTNWADSWVRRNQDIIAEIKDVEGTDTLEMYYSCDR
jgi:hypothetical protein